ncbi:MAG: hypothetical protein R2838_15930 [Caldilineaceae bacterium]
MPDVDVSGAAGSVLMQAAVCKPIPTTILWSGRRPILRAPDLDFNFRTFSGAVSTRRGPASSTAIPPTT